MRGELHARLAAAFGARVKAHGIVDIDDLAQVAIDTIREPTQAMTNAACATEAMNDMATALGVAAFHGCQVPDKYYLNDTPLVIWWRAMVDAER